MRDALVHVMPSQQSLATSLRTGAGGQGLSGREMQVSWRVVTSQPSAQARLGPHALGGSLEGWPSRASLYDRPVGPSHFSLARLWLPTGDTEA